MASVNKRVWKIVVNVIMWVVIVIVLLLAISALTSINKGYNSLFGVGMVGVRSESMTDNKEDEWESGSFNKYDYIFVKTLTDEQKQNLKVGDVIMFKTVIQNKDAVNTHRIIGKSGTGSSVSYTTQGDNNLGPDNSSIGVSDIVGQYTGFRIPLLGFLPVVVSQPTGFLIIVVIPSFLLVAYAVFALVKSVKAYNVEKGQVLKTQVLDEERERIKHELLEQMRLENEAKAKQDGSNEPKKE